MERDRKVRWDEFTDGFEENRERTLKQRDFTAAVADAVRIGDEYEDAYGVKRVKNFRSKAEKTAALDAIVAKGTDSLDSSQLMALFSAYRSLAEYDKMVKLYDGASNLDFKEAPLVRERLAHALRKRDHGKGTPEEKRDYMRSEAISINLIKEGYGNGVTYENIGLCRRWRAGSLGSGNKPEYVFKMQESVFVLEKGFAETFEASVGLQAAYGNMILGNRERGRETAKVAFLAALRDGAEESDSFHVVAAALQAACLSGEPKEVVDHFYNRMENIVRYDWELDNIEKRMRRICQLDPSENAVGVLDKVRDLRKRAEGRRDETGRVILEDRAKKDRYLTKDPVSQAVHDYSYNYRGCGTSYSGMNRVGGNTAFGGQLMDHVISRKDIRLMSEMVGMTPAELGIPMTAEEKKKFDLPLAQIKDPEAALDLIDRFVRQALTTENFAGTGLHMEENALAKNKNGESVYDATVKSMLRASGKKIGEKDTNIDTRTNIVAMLALGMGDCRHHAQLKQLMFDMCQKKQMNEQLGKLYAEVRRNKSVDLRASGPAVAFYGVLDTELRTTDVQVRMPVLMQQKNVEGYATESEGEWVSDDRGYSHWTAKYVRDADGRKVWEQKFGQSKDGEDPVALQRDKTYCPDLTADGKFKVDPKGLMHNLEDHTLCYLTRRERGTGRLESLKLCDAFYQSKDYHWKLMDVPVSKIKVTRKGKPIIPAGELSGDRTDTGAAVPIYHLPTPYNTGRRDTQVSDSIGRDVRFAGIRLEGFATAKELLDTVRRRGEMANIMLTTLKNDRETKDIDTLLPARAEKDPSIEERKRKCRDHKLEVRTAQQKRPSLQQRCAAADKTLRPPVAAKGRDDR